MDDLFLLLPTVLGTVASGTAAFCAFLGARNLKKELAYRGKLVEALKQDARLSKKVSDALEDGKISSTEREDLAKAVREALLEAKGGSLQLSTEDFAVSRTLRAAVENPTVRLYKGLIEEALPYPRR